MNIEAQQVVDARARIAPFAHRTPILTCATLDHRTGASVFLKCENFQRTGSFKFRGATNAVAVLASEHVAGGVYAHSSGNHAQALALAARLHGMACHIVMPRNSTRTKVEATRDYGAEITFCEPTHAARWETAKCIGEETGAAFVHPHDDPRVIAGQGTAALELIDEIGPCDLLLVPIGGGGLLSGTLLAVQHLKAATTVIGCEPQGADDAARGIAGGKRILDFTPHTIADGLRTPLGENTFAIIRQHVGGIVTISETDIVRAMRFVWERMKIIIEPSSAVAIAPLLQGAVETQGRRIGVIVSGGNVNLDEFFMSLEDSV